jgi:hypothetical protein
MYLLSMLFNPVPCYFLPLRSKYAPEHPILEQPQPMLLLECNTPSFTHTHTHTTEPENYSSVCFNPYIFGKQ